MAKKKPTDAASVSLSSASATRPPSVVQQPPAEERYADQLAFLRGGRVAAAAGLAAFTRAGG